MKHNLYTGDYCHTITVNGKSRVLGSGHTAQEAYRNALDGAEYMMPSVAVVFHLMRQSAYQAVDDNSVVKNNKRHGLTPKRGGIVRKLMDKVKEWRV